MEEKKLKVIGYDFYDKKYRKCMVDATDAVIEDIRKYGYKYCGDDYQDYGYTAPILSDGTMYVTSWRGWGAVMARAWGYTNPEDYSLFYMKEVGPKDTCYPSSPVDLWEVENPVTHIITVDGDKVRHFGQMKSVIPLSDEYYCGDKFQFVDAEGKNAAATMISSLVTEGTLKEVMDATDIIGRPLIQESQLDGMTYDEALDCLKKQFPEYDEDTELLIVDFDTRE